MKIKFLCITNQKNFLFSLQNSMTKEVENHMSITGSTPGFLSLDKLNSSNSDLSYHDDGNHGEDAIDDDVDVSDYDDNDEYKFDDDYYYNLSMKPFDNVDLPPGVEASVSWLQASAVSPSKSTTSSVSTQFDVTALSADAGTSTSVILDTHKIEYIASSGSAMTAESSSNAKEREDGGDEIMREYEFFKAFDTVEDFSDHHYTNMGFQGQQVMFLS